MTDADSERERSASPSSSTSNTPLFASSRQSTPNLQEVESDDDEYSTASTSPSTSSTCSSPSRQFLRSPSRGRSPGSGLPNAARDEAEFVDEEDDSRDSPETEDTSDEEHINAYRPRPRRRRRVSDDDERFSVIPKCPRPVHKWNAFLELNRFQLSGNALTYRRRGYGNLYMVQRLNKVSNLEGHSGCVNSVNFNAEGDLLVLGSDDLQCTLWDWQREKLLHVFETGHRSNIFQSKFMLHKDNSVIVTSARDGSVRLHQLGESGSSEVESRKIGYHRGAVHKIAMHPALQDTILTSGEDGCVCNIDIRLPNPTTLVTVRTCIYRRIVGLYSVAINPFRPFEFITAGTDQYVRVFDRRNIRINECVRKLCSNPSDNNPHSSGISCAVYNYDGSEILASYSDEDIYIFPNDSTSVSADNSKRTYLHKYQGHCNTQTVKGVNYFGQRSEYIVSGSDCGRILLWDKKTSHIVNFLLGDHEGAVNVLEPNPKAPYLATSGLDHDVKIWLPNAKEATNLEGLREFTIDNMRQREEDLADEFPMDMRLQFPLMHVIPTSMIFRLQRPSNSNSLSEDDTPDPAPQCPTS